jgi:hypothetical protein
MSSLSWSQSSRPWTLLTESMMGGNAILLGHSNGGILGSNLSGLTRPGSFRLVHLVDHHS